MSAKAEECRRKAEEAEAAAAKARDWDIKQTYLEIAPQWRAMAEQAEGLKL
jgi:hypothetical protein